VRREVALDYCWISEKSSIALTGRRGDSLLGGEDKEIAHVCCSHGLGIGVFPELKITHLIPKHRVSEDYLVRLAEGTAISDLLVDYKWRSIEIPSRLNTILSLLKTVLLHHGIDRRLRFARTRGIFKGRRILKAFSRQNG
jgi:hypothetical protein